MSGGAGEAAQLKLPLVTRLERCGRHTNTDTHSRGSQVSTVPASWYITISTLAAQLSPVPGGECMGTRERAVREQCTRG